MNIDLFDNISYLSLGTIRQKQAYKTLKDNSILEKLIDFNPLLAGTVPINIDIESSDLDIICCFETEEEFKDHLISSFSEADQFVLRHAVIKEIKSVIANFMIDNWEVEIFGQRIAVKEQMAYRHMCVEYTLLLKNGETFRQQIIQLKKQGYKTEPAFAKVLGLEGDPYLALLDLDLSK